MKPACATCRSTSRRSTQVALKLATAKGPEASKKVGDARARFADAEKAVDTKKEELRKARLAGGLESRRESESVRAGERSREEEGDVISRLDARG